jgi:hypothetical protein
MHAAERWSEGSSPGRTGTRVGVVIVVIVLLAVLLAVYNDFTIKQRVGDSFAGALPARAGLRAEGCRRLTSGALQSATFFVCAVGVGHASRAGSRRALVSYHLRIDGHCWLASRVPDAGPTARVAPRVVSGCLPVQRIAALAVPLAPGPGR